MLVPIRTILKKADKGGYAIGAFNTANLETTLAILRAAKAKKSPVIIQVSPATIKYAGLESITEIVKTLIQKEAKNTPVALHLDHGKDLKTVQRCLKAGFTSVHIDGSDLPYQKNIELTKKGAALAHRFGVWVQGELGALLGKEGMNKIKPSKNQNQYLTNPDQVAEFVRKTKIDTLAVSIGTKHGIFPGQEKINFKLLTQIKKKTKLPLVLHGASGVSDQEIRRAIAGGIRIINIDTSNRQAFTKALRRTLKQEPSFYDPRKILTPAIEAVEKETAEKMEIFGSAGKI